MKKLTWLAFGFSVLCLGHSAQAQRISHGPLTGAVSHDSARVWLRTTAATAFSIEYSRDSSFSSFQSASGSTRVDRDSSGSVVLAGLTPDTTWYYRVRIQGQLQGGRQQFRSFPLPGQPSLHGPLQLSFGSCQQRGARVSGRDGSVGPPTPEDSIFLPIAARRPHLFIHLGDWAYPNTDIANADTIIPYTREMSILEDAYRVRYAADSYPSQAQMFRNVALDYIYDDCDYIDGGSGGGVVATKFGNPDPPITLPFPPINRYNVIEAYHRYFPHYRLNDTTQGLYHKVTLGNVDVFVLDLRSNMDPFYDGFVYGANGRFTLQEPPGHSMLGAVQLQWLLQGLKQSTADWKVLVSSLTFHRGYDGLLDAAIPLQGQTLGGRSVTGLCYLLVEGWTAYRRERQSIIDWVRDENISGVVVISGDSHTGAIDDGTNAGLPELMSANLTVENGSFLNLFPTLWNRCSQGVQGVPLEETYGLLQAYGADSLRMVLLDQHDAELCSHTLRPAAPSTVSRPQNRQMQLYPNPVQDRLTLETSPGLPGAAELLLHDMQGRLLARYSLPAGTTRHEIDIVGQPRGLAVLQLRTGREVLSRVVALN